MGNSRIKEGDRVEKIRETEHLVVLKGSFSSLTKKKKTVEPNVVILMVFLLLWGSDGVPLGNGWVTRHPRRLTEKWK